MKEIIAKGKSLDEIRKTWAEEWECLSEDLELTIIQKPGLVNKNWTVRVTFRDDIQAAPKRGETRIVWDGVKYLIFPGNEVETVIPFPMAGKLKYEGREWFEEFEISNERSMEYYPLINNGDFSWDIEADEDGTRAHAKVRQERPGRFVINEDVSWEKKWFLERNISWEESPWSIRPETEQLFRDELKKKNIQFGIKVGFWQKILSVEGTDQIMIAERTVPIEPIHAILEDFESKRNLEGSKGDRIDYFSSNVQFLEKDDVIAKKIPGKVGIPGKDIFGREIPVEKMKDFNLKASKNAYLTEDSLEVRAMVPGSPFKLKNHTYAIEQVYLVNKDVDLNTGSIEFPGDVIVSNNVSDGFHVYSGGRVSIKGLVSGARLKAEGGINIGNNVFNSNITVGEKHYIRSQFVKKCIEIEQRLKDLLRQIEEIQSSVENPNISFKQLFRAVLERKYLDIPITARELSNLAQAEDEDFFTRNVITAVHTIKYFVAGIGPFEIKDNSYLVVSLREIHNFLLEKGNFVPENIAFVAGYIQNSEIKCSGDLICRRDIYNSDIRVEGNIKIFGVCRGSSLSGGKSVFVYELGSSEGGGDTIIRIPPSGHLTAEYCHSDVKIFIGKEYIPMEQTVRKLDVYFEGGKLWVDKLKWLDQ